MNLLDYVIIAIYILIILEVVISGVWKTNRVDLDAIKILTITILAVSVLSICSTFALDHTLRHYGVPEPLKYLLQSTSALTAFLIHQMIYAINRRRIENPQASDIKNPWKRPWRWLWKLRMFLTR